jgi:hypothetical protein
MRRLILGAAVALVLPAAAIAAADESPSGVAKSACKIEKREMGTKLFKTTYATKSAAKAMKACVAKTVPVAEVEAKNAAQACKDERDADQEAFSEKYGTNENNKNAYGKCVSAKAHEATEDAAEDRADAAQTCKALKHDDRAAFEQTYGTKKNAFGKCVSATANADPA